MMFVRTGIKDGKKIQAKCCSIPFYSYRLIFVKVTRTFDALEAV